MRICTTMQLNGQGLDDGRQGDLQQYFRNKPLWSTSCSVFFSDRSTVLNCDRRAFSQLRTFNRSKSRHRRRYCGGGIDSPGNVAFVLWRKHQKNSVPPYLTGRSNDDVDGKGELAGTKAVRGVRWRRRQKRASHTLHIIEGRDQNSIEKAELPGTERKIGLRFWLAPNPELPGDGRNEGRMPAVERPEVMQHELPEPILELEA